MIAVVCLGVLLSTFVGFRVWAAMTGAREAQADTAAARPADHGAEGDPSSASDVNAVQMTVYTASWCGACKTAKRWLAANKVPYTERDIDQDDRARADLRRISRGSAIPTFDIEGEVKVGFNARWVESTRRRVAALHAKR